MQTLYRGDLIGTIKEENALEQYDPMTSLVSLLPVNHSFPSIGDWNEAALIGKQILISYYTEKFHDEPKETALMVSFSKALWMRWRSL